MKYTPWMKAVLWAFFFSGYMIFLYGPSSIIKISFGVGLAVVTMLNWEKE